MNEETHSPLDGERPSSHIGRTTRSAFTQPGTRIGRVFRPPLNKPSGGLETDPNAPSSGADSEPGSVGRVEAVSESDPLSPGGGPAPPKETAAAGQAPDATRTGIGKDDIVALGLSGPPGKNPLRSGERPDPHGALLAIRILLAIWATLVVLSVVVSALTPATGDGFTRGLNRVYPFIGYQAVAAVIAFVLAFLSRSVRPVSKRWALIGLVPLAVFCLLVLGIIALLVVARA